jgi:hypothetical protein
MLAHSAFVAKVFPVIKNSQLSGWPNLPDAV